MNLFTGWFNTVKRWDRIIQKSRSIAIELIRRVMRALFSVRYAIHVDADSSIKTCDTPMLVLAKGLGLLNLERLRNCRSSR